MLGSTNLMPRRVQWFRIQLLRNQFTVHYVPDKCLATANMFSRDPEVLNSAASTVNCVELFESEVVTAHSKTKEGER